MQARRLARLGINNVCRLLCYYPRSYQDRRYQDLLDQAPQKEWVNILVRVRSKHWLGRPSQKILKVVVEDQSGCASLLCFGRKFLDRTLQTGRMYRVFGSFKYRCDELQSSNFEIEQYLPPEDRLKSRSGVGSFGHILPCYPLTEDLTQGALRRLVQQALLLTEDLEESLSPGLRQKHGFLEHRQALRAIHFPESFEELELARKSLVYEELFTYQLILSRLRMQRQSLKKTRRRHPARLKTDFLKRLPFRLTDDQQLVLAEIEKDLFSPRPAARLVQGDVGCGKTLVGFIASLLVIEAGEQVAFLAPTELLARQHAENAARLLEPLGIRVALLTGAVRGAPRKALTQALEMGEIDLLLGTHALFSAGIRYKLLGLVIVDEQQRFGVRQRQEILSKGDHPDLLLLTATPIPRTLALTLFADLTLSEIRSKPPGRKEIITHLTRQGNEAKVYERVRQEVAKGGQAYFVYPLIEDSKELKLKNAVDMFHILNDRIFPELRLGLIHSRMHEEDKRKVMKAFVAATLDILVATSVVEVGVDVPRASCMVIEHAERFGLSDLHQLRGRVGRGAGQAYTFMIYSGELTETGVQRLKVIKNLSDGFSIAEEDLRIRGPGEFLGHRQSGFLKLGLADLVKDQQLFVQAGRDVEMILDRDPVLKEHPTYRRLLNLELEDVSKATAHNLKENFKRKRSLREG